MGNNFSEEQWVNARSKLLDSVRGNDYDTVKKILSKAKKSKDEKKYKELVDARDADGNTAIHIACANQYTKLVELLIGTTINLF